MTRALAVIVVAALCGALLGVDESVSAAQDDAAREAARQQNVSARLDRIDVGSVVKIERNDGSRLEGVLKAKTPDSITVDVYQRRAFRRPRPVSTDTIPLDDIKEISKPLSGLQKTAIAAGVVVGGCAALALIAASSLDVTPSSDATPPESMPSTPSSGPPLEEVQ